MLTPRTHDFTCQNALRLDHSGPFASKTNNTTLFFLQHNSMHIIISAYCHAFFRRREQPVCLFYFRVTASTESSMVRCTIPALPYRQFPTAGCIEPLVTVSMPFQTFYPKCALHFSNLVFSHLEKDTDNPPDINSATFKFILVAREVIDVLWHQQCIVGCRDCTHRIYRIS